MFYCCLKRPLLRFFRSKSQLIYDKGQEDQLAVNLTIASRILSLDEFIKMRKETDPKYQLYTKPKEIFIYGVHPLKLKNYLFVYYKYGYWHQRSMGEQTLLSFIDRMSNEQRQISSLLSQNPNNIKALERQSLLIAYQKHISTTLLPSTISQMQICEPYIKILIKYLEATEKVEQIELKYILANFQNIMYNDDNDQEFISDREYGWLMISAFDLLVNRLKGKFRQLQAREKSLLICFAKTLRSNNLPFLEFVKKEMQQQRKQINFNEFLVGLNLLAINRSFPYEYFYKNKEGLMDLIEAADPLSEKKVKNSLALLEIFSRERLMYCEKIIDRLLECIQQNLVASNLQQLTRIFYYYSRLKSSIKHEFVVKLVERIYIFMDNLTQRDYSLIVKALANLNYQDEHLVQKLKEFNYELFLANLKYGCEKLGSFYKAILEEIQNSYQNDSLRYERLEDQIFKEVKFTPLENSLDCDKTEEDNKKDEKQAAIV